MPSRPIPELVHSELPDAVQRRLTRINLDARLLGDELTRAQARSAYRDIEEARDTLSKILGQADGPNV